MPRWWHPGPGGIAQLVEHLLCKQGVSGSNPLTSTIRRAIDGESKGRLNDEPNRKRCF